MTSGSLGIGKILGDTYGLFCRRILTYLVPMAMVVLVTVIFGTLFSQISMGIFIAQSAAGSDFWADAWILLLMAIALAVIYLTAMSTISLITIELKTGRRARIMAQLGRALRSTPMLILLGLVVFVILALVIAGIALLADSILLSDLASFLLLILACFAGLSVYVKLSPILPIIVHERTGLGAFRRSFELTQGYFWPILGLLIMNLVIILLLGIAVATLSASASMAILSGGPGSLFAFRALTLASQALIGILTYLIPVILSTLLYLRLRAIKEGIGTEDISTVFE